MALQTAWARAYGYHNDKSFAFLFGQFKFVHNIHGAIMAGEVTQHPWCHHGWRGYTTSMVPSWLERLHNIHGAIMAGEVTQHPWCHHGWRGYTTSMVPSWLERLHNIHGAIMAGEVTQHPWCHHGWRGAQSLFM